MDAAAIDIIRLQQVLQIRRRDTIPVKIAVDPELVDIEIRDHAEQRDRDRALRLQKVCCPCRERMREDHRIRLRGHDEILHSAFKGKRQHLLRELPEAAHLRITVEMVIHLRKDVDHFEIAILDDVIDGEKIARYEVKDLHRVRWMRALDRFRDGTRRLAVPRPYAGRHDVKLTSDLHFVSPFRYFSTFDYNIKAQISGAVTHKENRFLTRKR